MDIKALAEEAALRLKEKFENHPDFLMQRVEGIVLAKIAGDAEQHVTDLLSDRFRDQFNDLVVETINGWIKRGDLGKVAPPKKFKKAFSETLKRVDQNRAEEQFTHRDWVIFLEVDGGRKAAEVAARFDITPSRVSQICRYKARELGSLIATLERCGYKIERPERVQ